MKIWFPEIDILKATAILLIVFCHIDNYVSCYDDLIRLVDGYAALIGLSIFFFISGLLLSHTDSAINSIKDIKNFYSKRFTRIFPLYWVALISLAIIFGWLQVDPGNVKPYDFSLSNLLIHFFGLQGVFPYGNIQSMWFVGVIILFYLLYPFIAYFSKNLLRTFTISSIIFILLAILHHFFGLININALMYYPLFVSGIFIDRLIYSSKRIADKTILKQTLVLSFSLIFALLILNNINLQLSPTILTMCTMIALCIFYLIFARLFINVHGNKMGIISPIAFGTYAIYLFHHQFLALFTSIIDLIIQNIMLQDITILTFGIVGVALCGIIIQKVEQSIFKHYRASHQR